MTAAIVPGLRGEDDAKVTGVAEPAHYDVLIVGTGHAGAQAAIGLRQRKFAGTIALIGEEAEPPYERPPLSKDYLSGTKSFDRMLIRPATFWTERAITLLPGRRVVSVDPAAHSVATADGEAVGYGVLVWAAGGHARPIDCAGGDAAGVHTLRHRADADRLIAEMPAARNVVVIGGGYIGLEAAAVLARAGKAVVLVEAQDRVLARVAGERLSRFYEAEHRRHGVTIMLDCAVACIEVADGRATGVRLADGSTLPADIVIVGIGLVPAVAPLLAAGAEGGDGVFVDDHCRTSLPDVFAIGDCATHVNAWAGGRRVRIESIQNANDQAAVVAGAITGGGAPYDAIPWFWSDQYDLKLQTVGVSAGHDDAVVRGDPAARSFSIVYLRDGRVIALDCVNAMRDYVQGRALVAKAASVPRERLADAGEPLKSMLLSD